MPDTFQTGGAAPHVCQKARGRIPAFDESYRVTAIPSIPSVPMPGADQVLTPDVQQRIMAHDDWVFRAERYLLSCVSRGPFRSAEEVSQRSGR